MQDLAPWIGPIVTVAGMIAGVWWHLLMRVQAVKEELAEYRLEVAERYAQTGNLKEVELRLVGSIDRLAERIDKVLDHLAKGGSRTRTP